MRGPTSNRRLHDPAELLAALDRIGRPRILVVGDLMLDRYTWGNAERISPEAPVIVLRSDKRELKLGGAAGVAQMLKVLDADVDCAGVIGDDSAGRRLRRRLTDIGISPARVISDEARPTTVKDRFIGQSAGRHAHQMLRVDREVSTPIPSQIEHRLCATLSPMIADLDALLISDYGKGVCTPRVCQELISVARSADVPVLIDPTTMADYGRYRGATAITPNRLETALVTASDIVSPAEAIRAAKQLCCELDLRMTLVTLDRDGIALAQSLGDSSHFPVHPRDVYDITGAGDTVLAVFGLALASGLSPNIAVHLANLAAGLQVEQVGVATIPRSSLREAVLRDATLPFGKILSVRELTQVIAAHRNKDESIVFANGCFDLLHHGHVRYLTEAAQLGDVLIVALNSDESVRRLKGNQRPIISHNERSTMLAALRCVDYVVIYDEDTPYNLLNAIRPDVLVKGGTYTIDQVVGRELVEAYGGRVCVTSCVDGVSTTEMVARLRRNDGPEPCQSSNSVGNRDLPAVAASTTG